MVVRRRCAHAFQTSHCRFFKQRAHQGVSGHETESVCSLGDVFGLSTSTEVGALLSLIVGVDSHDTLVVLLSLEGTTLDFLVCALSLGDLRCLISDFTITGQ